ncbi:MAG: methyl-accepting chemotaxis protein [Actinomycetota bacterium]
MKVRFPARIREFGPRRRLTELRSTVLKPSVGVRLAVGSAVVLVLAVVVAWAGLRAAGEVDGVAGAISRQTIHSLNRLSQMVKLAETNFQSSVRFTVIDDPRERLLLRDEIWQSDREVTEKFEEFTGHDHDHVIADESDVVRDLEKAWSLYVNLRNIEVLARPEGELMRARLAAVGEVRDAFLRVRDLLSQLEGVETAEARALRSDARAALHSGRKLVVGAFAAAALLGLAIALFQSRRIAGALASLTAAASDLADGDLSRRAEVETSDEIEELADAFNSMAERLQETVSSDRAIKDSLEQAVRDYSAFAAEVAHGDLTARVSSNGNATLTTLTDNLNAMVASLGKLSALVARGAQGVGSAATQMLETAHRQSATVTEQSAAISQTSVTVDELRASSEHMAGQAKEVAGRAQTSVTTSDEGTRVLSDITERMSAIKERVEAIATNILTLSEQTQQIGDITTTVDDIAEQSNLLALNATIEAARAGEHGKGFAVVAAEVRNLAEQSKQATAQVRGILTDIQKATNSAVMATEQGSRSVTDGAVLAERAQQAITELAATIRDTASAAQQITASAAQQSIAVEQVADAMKDINHAAVQFVAGVDHSSEAAAGLNDLARELQLLTERYKVGDAP